MKVDLKCTGERLFNMLVERKEVTILIHALVYIFCIVTIAFIVQVIKLLIRDFLR